MNYEQFFSLAYDNYIYLIFFSVSFMLLYLCSLRKFVISGILDPFHFIYSFVFSTSYSVIIVLYINDRIDYFYLLLLTCYGIAFLFPIYYFAHCKRDGLSYFIYSFFQATCKGRKTKNSFIFFYFLLLILMISIKGFSLFTSTNRFEDNAGIGVLARFYDIIWYFVAGVYIIYYKEAVLHAGLTKKIFLSIPFFSFFIVNLFIIGSKSELIQYVLFYYLVLSVYGFEIRISLVKGFVLLFVSMVFALFVLYFNFNLQGDDNLTNIISETFFRLTDRIMSNGDMYYLGLPNEVIEKINTNNVLVDFFTPILSSGFLSSLAGYDVYSYDIGKQILLYHYPEFNLAGGPVEHFDLFGYKHFGIIGGCVFSLLIGFFIVIARNTTFYAKGNKYMSVIMAAFYFKMLFAILKPSILLGYIFDFIFVYVLLLLFSTIFSIKSQRNG